MAALHGFILSTEQNFPDFGLKAQSYVHEKTGAQLLVLLNDDENRTFSISFRTPPEDSRGIPHVLEHSVLCGSRKFPLRDPFAVLLKSSLHTFLNAFTSSLYTSYPAASQNEEDFRNLISVYLDATLHPLLTRETFLRQAWHYELSDRKDYLTRKGVVLNEMRGRYAESDSILYRQMLQNLLPGTPYIWDSGGNPEEIPDLTHEDLKKFHERYYHPSNAFVCLYGKLEVRGYLEYLNAIFGEFEPQEYSFEELKVPELSSPRELTLPYSPVGEDDGQGNIITMSWLIPYDKNLEREVGLALLSRLLFGNQAARLTRALVESGLGQKPSGFGLFDVDGAGIFSAGLRGVESSNKEKVERLILEVLKTVADEPFPPEEIDAALNSFEFGLREQIANSPSKGISVLHYVLGPWLSRGDPFYELGVFKALEAIRARLARGERVFERLTQETLTDSSARLKIVMEPDRQLQESQRKREAEYCESVLKALDESAKDILYQEQRQLDSALDEPEPDEVVSKVPVLRIEAIDRQQKLTPLNEEKRNGFTFMHEPIETAEIIYGQLCLDMNNLPEDLFPFVPLFARALTATGAGSLDYIQLTRRIQASTGGVSPSRLCGMVRDTLEPSLWFLLEGSCLSRNARDLFELKSDILMRPWLHNKERCIQIVRIMKASLEESLTSRPVGLAVRRAQKSLAESLSLEERMSGVSQLFFMRDLVGEIEGNWEIVHEKMERIKGHLISTSGSVYNLTAPGALKESALPFVDDLMGNLSPMPSGGSERGFAKAYTREALSAPINVSYPALALDLGSIGFEAKGSFMVVLNYLRDTLLWDQIRVQGGAYGAGCSYDETTRILSLYAWDDPNPARTVEVLERAGESLANVGISQSEINRNIVGTIGGLDRPLSPNGRGIQTRNRRFLGITNEQRQREREEALSTTLQDFRLAGEAIIKASNNASAAVICPPHKCEELREKSPEWATIDMM